MDYVKTTLKEVLTIKQIVTIHYFEYAKDYVFEGEKHDFWEFLYVDKGEVDVMADSVGYKLHQGEIIFHKPNEFHNVWANGKVAPNLIVVSFHCKSKAVDFFRNKILRLGDSEKNLLAQIIKEATNSFSSPLNDTYMKKLERNSSPAFGSEQLIKLCLEQMLIILVRRGDSIKKEIRISSAARERSHNNTANKIIHYLNENVTNIITFDHICRQFSISATNLKVLFREVTGTGVMEYYNKLKIEEAKRLIRETPHNFTGIADILGYTSIHYFSRHFKKVTGMTPSEYATSVKVKI